MVVPVIVDESRMSELAQKLASMTAFLLDNQSAALSFYLGVPSLWPVIRQVASFAAGENSPKTGDSAGTFFMVGVLGAWAACGIFDLFAVTCESPNKYDAR